METIEVNIEERTDSGSSASRRLRAQGLIPAVVYSKGQGAQMVALSSQEYVKRVLGCGPTQLFRFKSKEAKLNGTLALIKDIDIEPIKDKVRHLDFLSVSAETRVIIAVPIELQGENALIKGGDAILNQSIRELQVECFPTNIPRALAVDISGLVIGKGIHAKDVKLPEGVSLKSDGELAVVSVAHKKEVVEEKPVEAAAPVEGEAVAAPGTAAPAPEKGEKEKKSE